MRAASHFIFALLFPKSIFNQILEQNQNSENFHLVKIQLKLLKKYLNEIRKLRKYEKNVKFQIK